MDLNEYWLDYAVQWLYASGRDGIKSYAKGASRNSLQMEVYQV